jgi:hypothetical protein
MPVLAIPGTGDKSFTRAQVDALRALIPAAVDACGMRQRPHQLATKAVLSAAARFIADVSTRT